MRQLNIHITPEFEKNLNKFMKYKKLDTKSEALRVALKEALEQLETKPTAIDFRSWIGLGKQAPENKKLQFKTHDYLWK